MQYKLNSPYCLIDSFTPDPTAREVSPVLSSTENMKPSYQSSFDSPAIFYFQYHLQTLF